MEKTVITVPAIGIANTKKVDVKLDPLSTHWRGDIVRKVAEHAREQGIMFDLDTVVGKGNVVKIIMLVDDTNKPMGEINESLKKNMYDCVATSLFDNFDDVGSVCFCFNTEHDIQEIAYRK